MNPIPISSEKYWEVPGCQKAYIAPKYNGINQPFFSLFRCPIQTTTPCLSINLADAYNYIISPYAKERTEQLRKITDTKQHSQFKTVSFDFCTFSGIFSKRTDRNLIFHSNLICLDFDHLPDVEATFNALKEDRYFETQLLFHSPSGDGLKWVISFLDSYLKYRDGNETKAEYQQRLFKSLYNYIFNHYNVQVDKMCRNVSRACFLPYDPQAFLNPKLL
ncbi:MAG: virulence protein E [Bacteroidales bacterium]|nr:virulence protein E [Bacteroidales bacterium]